MGDAEESAFVERLRRREERAFNELVRRYEERVFRLVLRMVGSREEAEDLAQEVFVTVFKAIDSFREEAKLSTWIYRIATNHCRNRIKYLSRRARPTGRDYEEIVEVSGVESATRSTSAHVPAPDQVLEGRRMETIVQEALRTLDEEHRELIVLREIENMTYEEICAITELPIGTLKSRLHRARAALHDAVSDASRRRKA